MTVFTYSRVPAFNPNTTPVSVARSATGNVYDIGDTGFTTPLNLTLVATNTVTTTLVSDANGMFPDFTLVDRPNVVFKSGSQVFVLTTTTPVPGPQGAPSTVPGPPGPATTDASLLTAGTVADARLPQRLQVGDLSATIVDQTNTRLTYAVGADRSISNPGVLQFSPHFIPSGEEGDHYGVMMRWNGTRYQIQATPAKGNVSRVFFREPLFSIVGDQVYDPFLLPLPNGNWLMGFHSGDEGAIRIWRSTDKGATWVERAYLVQLARPTGLTATPVATGGTFAAGTYYYTIAGTGTSFDSIQSTEVSATVVANGSVNLSWAALPANTNGVKVYRGTTAGGAKNLIATLGAVTSYTDTGTAGTAATPGGYHRYSEVMMIRATSGSVWTSTPNRIVAAWASIDPLLPKTRDSFVVTAFSDDEGLTWSAPKRVTPASGASSCGLLDDNQRPWLFEDDNADVNLIYTRVEVSGPTAVASLWHTKLNNVGAVRDPEYTPVKITDAPLAVSSASLTVANKNGCSPAVFMGRDGFYRLVWGEANYGNGGSDGKLMMKSGDGNPLGWSATTQTLTNRTDCPNGYGRPTPHRIGGVVEILHVRTASPTATDIRSLTLPRL